MSGKYNSAYDDTNDGPDTTDNDFRLQGDQCKFLLEREIETQGPESRTGFYRVNNKYSKSADKQTRLFFSLPMLP